MELWRRYLDWRRRHVAALELAEGGFRLAHGRASQVVVWQDIRQITAFKRDLYAFDCICLLIATPDGVMEVNEQMEGFIAFREAMEAHFGFAPTWYIQIMTPVFEPTPIHLYRHPDLIEPAP